MKSPKYAIIGNKKYKINTDFRTALACFKAINDDEIDDIQRAYAIVGLLFGFNVPNEYINEALEKAKIYLSCGKKIDVDDNEIDMDYEEDYDYIVSSFEYCYHINLEKINDMSWHYFFSLLNGLDNKCILNKVREIRNYDITKISDDKEREQMILAKERLALKKKITKEEQEEIDEFNSLFE